MSQRDPSRTGSRASERVSVEAQVDLEFPSFQGFISEIAANLSVGGMFVRSDQPVAPGTMLSFTLRLKDDVPLVHGTGRVAWTREADLGPTAPMGMGIRFLKLDGNSAELVARIVDQYRAEGGIPFELDPTEDDAAFPGGAARYSSLTTSWPPPPDDLDLPPEEPHARVDPGAWEPPSARDEEGEEPARTAETSPAPFRLDLDDGEAAELGEVAEADGWGSDPSPLLEEQAAVEEGDDWSERANDPWGLADLEVEEEAASQTAAPAGGEAPPRPTRQAPPVAPTTARQATRREPPPKTKDPRLEGTGSLAGLIPQRDPDPVSGLTEEIFVPPEAGGVPPRPEPPPPVKKARRRPSAAVFVVLALVAAVAVAGYAFHDRLASWLGGYQESMGERVVLDVPPPATLESAGQVPPEPEAPVAEPAAAIEEPAAASATASPEPVAEEGEEIDPLVLSPVPAGSQRFDQVRLITWKHEAAGTTVVTLWGNGQLRPADVTHVRLEGRPQRELLKLRGINWPFRDPILDANTEEVRRIRTGFHPKVTGNELHIVFDLTDPAVHLSAISRDGNKILLTLSR